jgi:hypothetical protein
VRHALPQQPDPGAHPYFNHRGTRSSRKTYCSHWKSLLLLFTLEISWCPSHHALQAPLFQVDTLMEIAQGLDAMVPPSLRHRPQRSHSGQAKTTEPHPFSALQERQAMAEGGINSQEYLQVCAQCTKCPR